MIVHAQHSKGKGKTRARSRLADLSVKGTAYVMEVRCRRTIMRVFSGTVTVFDRIRGISVPVTAGHTYVVNRPGF